MSGVQRFQAVLVAERALGWTVATLPFEPHAVWPAMVRLRVRGEIRGSGGTMTFRTSLFSWSGIARSGAGDSGPETGFYLLVNRAMQQGAGVKQGSVAEFRLEPDLEERPADLPEELDALLDEVEGLRAWYGELSEYTRRYIGQWIGEVKGDEARLRRAGQMAERLLNTMEAEVELPPLIEQAFRAQPKARAGWQAMTSAQRRAELFAVFSYQSPESRTKRLGKLIETALKRTG